jgi:hypothetical protein
MSLSLYDQVTNVLCVSLLSHDRYQYDNPLRSRHTGACPSQHSQQLLRCFALDRLDLQEAEEHNLCLWHIRTRKNHRALDPDFLVATMSVPRSGLLIGVWNELDYGNDICRVTKGSYIEHL